MALNVALIRESFEAVVPHADAFIEHFYEELFERYPQAKGLFKKVNMPMQRKALANSLAHIVEFLEEEDHLVDYLRKMGARHIKYGTAVEHFDWVGESLLATFKYFFEEQWTPELMNNWSAAYGFIAGEMQKGMSNQNKKVVEMKKNEPTFEQIAHEITSALLKKSVDEAFASPEFNKVVQDRAREMLKKAIENEARQMLSEIRPEIKSA